MIVDEKAEELERAGLYRRAARRWLEVMDMTREAAIRDKIAARRARCISLARLPPQQTDNFGDVKRAAKEAQQRMGRAQSDGSAFRF